MFTAVIMPAGFGVAQIVLIGIPGFTSLLLYRWFHKKLESNPKPWKPMLQDAWQQTKQEFSRSTVKTVGLTVVIGLTIINFGFGQLYISMFPMNLRALYLVILIPLNGMMILFQSWLYFQVLFKYEKSLGKIIGTVLITKFGWLYLVGLILLLFGNWFITFILLLTIFDLIATIIMLIVYHKTQKYGATLVWTAIFLSTAYIGFGVYMGWFRITFGF